MVFFLLIGERVVREGFFVDDFRERQRLEVSGQDGAKRCARGTMEGIIEVVKCKM